VLYRALVKYKMIATSTTTVLYVRVYALYIVHKYGAYMYIYM
jgi:hypothetical protein